ncbi:LANO_0F00694g1_1 [Lachancea nothofagi CBS 11611]|uniref:LANO_0F00694g1_1 n=1 Tax=Lachancea nothofagi CBS 11611 TaxID=1266666 RepID=A0A1G4K5L9_9SACH|nr:LANO_0F00694g1_1 [Lachancea nothofagi CBS 11611]
MAHLSLKSVGNVFKKKDKELEAKEEDDDPDASEFEDDDEKRPKPQKSRRPKDTPFTQQRIACVNPVVTPRGVISFYIFLAAIFVIFGAVLLKVAMKVDQVLIYYHDCSMSAPTSSWGSMSEDQYRWEFHKNLTYNEAPQWRYIPPTSSDIGNGTCQIRFTTPHDLPKSVFVSYWVENFYGNHRRYVLSFSEDQINGKNTSVSTVKNNPGINCKPLTTNAEGKQYYPCGLIANSMFNDTFPMELMGIGNMQNYSLTNKGIAWSTDKNRYKKTELDYTQIAPPLNWIKQYPNGYNSTNIPDINTWEEFQNWMKAPAFSTFQRLIRRNDNDTLLAGEYQIDIGLNWPVREFSGKKGVFLTHGSSIGGKNNFLGVVYLVGGIICFAMALLLLVVSLITGRSVGDLKYLSWNREAN